MRSSIWVGSVLAFVMGTLGCGSDPLPAICRIDGECVSGRCGADGTCTPPALDASTSDAAVMHDGGSMGDGGSTRDGGVVVDAGMTGCVPNNDGVIESRELPFSEAREARYRVRT